MKKELRIGNYYYHPIALSFERMDDVDFISSFIEKFEPIPLTEEWLLKFGFDGNNSSDFDIDISKYQKLGLGLNGQRWYCGFGSMSKGYARYYTDMFMYLDYVHQLQNLYHALTGNELTITE